MDNHKSHGPRNAESLPSLQNYTLIIVSSEDDESLVKGGIGVYTSILTRSLKSNCPNYAVHWVTESCNGTHATFVDTAGVTRHYLPRLSADNVCEMTLVEFATAMSDFVGGLVESICTIPNQTILLESPDWEGLLGPLFSKGLPSNVLKIVRLHSSLSLCAEFNGLDLARPTMAEQLRLERLQFAHADLFSAPTTHVVKESLRRSIITQTSSVVICPNPIDLEGARSLLPRNEAVQIFQEETGFNISAEDFNIFVVGSAERRKGLEIILSAIPEICMSISKAHIFFIGHVARSVHRQLTANEKLTAAEIQSKIPPDLIDRVHVVGYLARKILLRVLNAGDLFPICYLSDNFPNAVLEIGLARRPLVVHMKGGIPEIVAEKGGEAMCASLSGSTVHDLSKSLAKETQAVYSDVNKKARDAERLYHHMVDNFQSEKIVTRLFGLYEGYSASQVGHSHKCPSCEALPVLVKRADFGGLLQSLSFRVGAEVGVQRGKFAETTLRVWEKCTTYYLIDCWRQQDASYNDIANVENSLHEANLAETKKRLEKWQTKLIYLRMFTEEAVEHIADEELDYVFIDARHDYESVLRDMALYLPKIRRGGIMAGHDFVDNDFVRSQGVDWSSGPSGRRMDDKAVKSAVIEFTASLGKQLIICYDDGDWPSWYFRV